jgi:type II secretory pathway predicted ATPase ExeA
MVAGGDGELCVPLAGHPKMRRDLHNPAMEKIGDPAAVDLLASRLRRPLQIEQLLTLALETGYQANEKAGRRGDRGFCAVQADRRP